MAHHKSAIKRIKQSDKKRLYNRQNKKLMKDAVKSVRTSKTYEDGMEKLSAANKILDKIASHKIIHKNEAANRMKILSKYVKSLKAAS